MAVPAFLKERSSALERGMQVARNLRLQAVQDRDRLQSDGVTAREIEAIRSRLESAKATFQGAAGIDGFWAYVQREYEDMTGDTTLDVETEFYGLMAQIDAAIAKTQAVIPTDTDGYLLERKWAADGSVEYVQLTPTEVAPLATALDELAAMIQG